MPVTRAEFSSANSRLSPTMLANQIEHSASVWVIHVVLRSPNAVAVILDLALESTTGSFRSTSRPSFLNYSLFSSLLQTVNYYPFLADLPDRNELLPRRFLDSRGLLHYDGLHCCWGRGENVRVSSDFPKSEFPSYPAIEPVTHSR